MQATMVATRATTYALTHSITFMNDNLLNTLREVIREHGLSPDKLMNDRDTLARGITTWLRSGHLTDVVVEFYKPGGTTAEARWEFPVRYAGSGVDDDMWLDKNYLRQLIAKAKRPSADCSYRVILLTTRGRANVSGFSSCTLLSTGALVARHAVRPVRRAHARQG